MERNYNSKKELTRAEILNILKECGIDLEKKDYNKDYYSGSSALGESMLKPHFDLP